MPYVYPGQAFDHTLQALKGWYRETALDAEVALSSNVNIGGNATPATAGLVVHGTDLTNNSDAYGSPMTGPKSFVVEMGCGPAHGMPMYLMSRPTDPDVYNPGTVAGDPVYGTANRPADFFPVFPAIQNQKLNALIASGAYELETTEYDTAQTYATGQPLRAVTSNTDANAGKLTNQRGTTAAFNSAGVVQFVGNTATVTAWDTIVGMVSRGTYVNSYQRPALAFYSWFVPGNR